MGHTLVVGGVYVLTAVECMDGGGETSVYHIFVVGGALDLPAAVWSLADPGDGPSVYHTLVVGGGGALDVPVTV